MFKKILFFCLLFGALNTVNVFASNLPQTVRVGLASKYDGVGSVSIGNKSLYLGFEQNGSVINEALINSSGGFTATVDNSFYLNRGSSYSSYDQAAQVAQSSGQRAVVAYRGNEFLVYYGYSTKGEVDNAKAQYGGEVISPDSRQILLTPSGGVAVLFCNSSKFGCITDGGGNFIELGDKKYRDSVELARTSKGITCVNVINTEKYLYSVVASEMPSQWHIEALKAQSVAARGYTLTRIGVHKDTPYELCDLVHCQLYLGKTNEADSTIRAVTETTGVIAYHNGMPINATFFSSSGGVTEQGDKVWSNSVPYLQSVKEVSEREYKQWTRTFTLDDITSLLKANNANIGNAVGVSVSSSSVSGRVTDLTIRGTNGTKTYTKGEVRTFFDKSSGGTLESTNFIIANGQTIETDSTVYVLTGDKAQSRSVKALYVATGNNNKIIDRDVSVLSSQNSTTLPLTQRSTVETNTGSITFSGKGWGHGVGMSQFGAKGMAEAGYTYNQILKHYFTGIEVY